VGDTPRKLEFSQDSRASFFRALSTADGGMVIYLEMKRKGRREPGQVKDVRGRKEQRQERRVTRDMMSRMLRLHGLVVAGEYPNATRLAAEFGVTVKTITRDVEHMRQEYGMPLKYDPVRHGYYYSEKPPKFPPGAPELTEQDLFALFVAQKVMAQYEGLPLHGPLEVAFQKLMSLLDTRQGYAIGDLGEMLEFRPFAPEEQDAEVFQAVMNARREQRMLRFHYRKPGEKHWRYRTLYPYSLTCIDGRWYAVGRDPEEKKPVNVVKKFMLARIRRPVLSEERFVRPKDFDLNRFLADNFSALKGSGNYRIVVEFDAWATDHLRGRRWHSSQQVTELSNGGSRMEFQLSALEEIQRWILSWEEHATVLEPEELKARVSEKAERILAKYRED
jgi:predicted DNA-binding transcriptional regulator YafY